jgi:hypothetical protein
VEGGNCNPIERLEMTLLIILLIALCVLFIGGILHDAPDEEVVCPKDEWSQCPDCGWFTSGKFVTLARPRVNLIPFHRCDFCQTQHENRIKQSIAQKIETKVNK